MTLGTVVVHVGSSGRHRSSHMPGVGHRRPGRLTVARVTNLKNTRGRGWTARKLTTGLRPEAVGCATQPLQRSGHDANPHAHPVTGILQAVSSHRHGCLLYTSDAADE